jgi:hypothetical protein
MKGDGNRSAEPDSTLEKRTDRPHLMGSAMPGEPAQDGGAAAKAGDF